MSFDPNDADQIVRLLATQDPMIELNGHPECVMCLMSSGGLRDHLDAAAGARDGDRMVVVHKGRCAWSLAHHYVGTNDAR